MVNGTRITAKVAPVGGPLTGHTESMLAVLVLPDGTPIAVTGSNDTTVRVWEVVEETPLPRLPGYRSDTVAGVDLLNRQAEAVAIGWL